MGERLTRFNNWFFKGRIEKADAKRERIETLSKEYDDGKVLRMGYDKKGEIVNQD